MKKRSLALALAFILLLPACAPRMQRFQAEFPGLFDTVVGLTAYAQNREDFDALSSLVHDSLVEYDRLYDIYNDYPGINNLKTVNDAAGRAPVRVDARITGLLSFCAQMEKLTSGAVNVAMGSVLTLWHASRENPEGVGLPSGQALKNASSHTDIADMIIDGDTVYLADPDMSLDVGAVAKGYAAQRVCEQAEAAGYHDFLLNMGGNVCAVGLRGDGAEWSVGIQNPSGDGLAATVSLSDLSAVTSGVYERYFTLDGKRYHHIIDPETLFPSDRYLSVSLLCADSGLADALSTALFNLSVEDGQALVETLPGVAALWVEADGAQTQSPGFNDYLQD